MADRRGAVFPLIFFIYLILQPTLQPARPYQDARFDETPKIERVIEEEQRQLAELANSTWDSEFGHPGHLLNVTGLEPDRGFAWDALPSIRTRAIEQLEYAQGEWAKPVLEGQPKQPNPTPMYHNITGRAQGKWKRSRLQEHIAIPQLNLTKYTPRSPLGRQPIPRPFDRNITGDSGQVTVRVGEQSVAEDKYSDTVQMAIELDIADSNTYNDFSLVLYGVYFTDLGQAIFTTTSDKFAGIFALPHFALSNSMFERSKLLLNDSITGVIEEQRDGVIDRFNPWSSRSEGSGEDTFAFPKCEMVVYMHQMAPVTSTHLSSTLLAEVERELRFPTGASANLPEAPDLRFSMLVFSPDCGFVLESHGPPDDIPQDGDHLTGPKLEVQHKLSRHHITAFAFALVLQMYLLMRQMREASTPSTRSRISLYTVAMLAFGDGISTMAFLSISLIFPGVWVNFLATGFLAFLSVAFFSMRFISDIWQAQAPERERRIREELEEEREIERRLDETLARIRAERLARQHEAAATGGQNPAPPDQHASDIDAETTTAAANDQTVPSAFPAAINQVAPRPVDTGATPVPFYMPSDQGDLLPVAREPLNARTTDAIVAARMPSFLSAYVRFYALMIFVLILSGTVASWPGPLRRVYFTILGLCYLGFWVPQIIRNIQRHCRHALNWDFVVGQSILRLTPFAYVYAYKGNLLGAVKGFYVLAIFAAWIWIQVVLLGSQEIVGPRWFIRSDWAPPAYDYHPVLRDDEEGATMPIGFSQATATADNSTPSSPSRERKNSTSMPTRTSTGRDNKEKGRRVFDCAICMQDLEVPIIAAGAPSDAGGLTGNLLARRTYMVTPCRHIFHSNCLESWMKHRLQCPICRETLPPL